MAISPVKTHLYQRQSPHKSHATKPAQTKQNPSAFASNNVQSSRAQGYRTRDPSTMVKS